MAFPQLPLSMRTAVDLSKRYISVELSAGSRLDMRKALGETANLLVVLAEEDSSFRINNQGTIPLKRDEATVMINVMDVASIYVESGQIKVFATTIPRWMPALFWTRSVTVLGVADAVLSALQQFYNNTKANTWLPAFKIMDVEVPTGEIWHIGGNMLQSVRNLTVKDGATLVISDSALLRNFGNLTIEGGGKIIVEDNAQVISESL